jgi:hypothetical protein
MPLPVIPIALGAIISAALGGGGTAAFCYAQADQRTRNRWNRIVCRWIGIPIDQAARAPRVQRQSWKQHLEEASLRKYGKPVIELSNWEGEQLIEELPPSD